MSYIMKGILNGLHEGTFDTSTLIHEIVLRNTSGWRYVEK